MRCFVLVLSFLVPYLSVGHVSICVRLFHSVHIMLSSSFLPYFANCKFIHNIFSLFFSASVSYEFVTFVCERNIFFRIAAVFLIVAAVSAIVALSAARFSLCTISRWNIKLVWFYRCNELCGVFILSFHSFSINFSLILFYIIFFSICYTFVTK